MTLAQTSLDAWDFVREDLGARQLQVYNAMLPGRDYSNTEIARLTGLPINCVTKDGSGCGYDNCRCKGWRL